MKTPIQLDRDIDEKDLADYAGGKFKYDATKRARLAYVVESILRDRGVSTAGADDAALMALARAELARAAAPAPVKKDVLGRGSITEAQARTAVLLLARDDREPVRNELEARQLPHVKHVGKRWRVMSAIGGGTITYETTDPALLFDYARRGQLGPHIRDAEEFRGLAYERAA